MPDISVNSRLMGLKDVKVHVDDYGGSGRTVILIHGWPLSGKAWAAQIDPLLAAGYHVVTYDRRGFGSSDKPSSGYDYDTFAEDLDGLINELEVSDVTLVGFSMGGGEVARYVGIFGEAKLHSVVFAASIPPMLLKSDVNPDGPLDQAAADKMAQNLKDDSAAFFETFAKGFYSPNGDGNILVTEKQLADDIAVYKQADPTAALSSMEAFASTDFRDDLVKVTVPTLVIHGDADGIVPFPGSGQRTHAAIKHSELYVIKGGPHGINVSHTSEFNTALLAFLAK